MTRIDISHIYSLYNEDDGVVIYECREDADEQRLRLKEFVPVEGPFEHPRMEKQIIIAADEALNLLRRLQREHTQISDETITCVIKQLEEAFDSLTGPMAIQ